MRMNRKHFKSIAVQQCWQNQSIFYVVGLLFGLGVKAVEVVASGQTDQPKQENSKSNGDDQTSVKAEDSKKGPDSIVAQKRSGHLVQVPMPITGSVAERVVAAIGRVVEKENASSIEDRPILVLEFDNRNGANGIGSEFEACLKIARYLTSPALNKLRTVAYLPGMGNIPKELFADGEKQLATFQSHVVLVALSCEEIAMHKEAAIGNAGIELPAVDQLYETAYKVMAEKRRVSPTLFALSMLDKSKVVYRVELKPDGVKYVDEAE